MALAPRLAPGSLFARDFKIVDLLAEGGMGAVYRAEQLSTRKMRAVKLVSTPLARDPKGRERFVREATVGASIDSEHAVEVIGAGIDDDSGRPWLAMELLDGADLGAVVRHQGPLLPAQLREVIGQLCHGLSAAHQAGVVHRDLKPANIYVARSRRAGVPFTIKILDFGIAKVVQESGSGATDTDTVGSPLWMAPEQLNAQRPTPATDVWALGLLAFWALTGKHYWIAAHSESSTVQALFVEQLFKPLVPPSARAVELGCSVSLPAGFDQWFLHCTHRDPPQRYPDASTAAQALLSRVPHHPRVAAARSAFEGEQTQADARGIGADLSHAPLTSGTTQAPHRSGPSAVVVTLGVAAVVGVMAGGGYLAWQWQSQRGQGTTTVAQTSAEPPSDSPAGEVSTSGSANADADDDAGDGGDAGTEPTADTGAASEDRDPMLEPVVPLRTQLDRKAHALRFLGWSDSGHRFALRAEYRDDRKGKRNRATLIQVHDALTGLMVESFLVSRDADEGVSAYRTLSKAVAQARPNAEWEARREALGVTKRSAKRERPGGGRLILDPDDAPAGTKLTLIPAPMGAAFRWSVDPPATGYGVQPQWIDNSSKYSQSKGPNPKAPSVTVNLDRDGEQWPLLTLEPPYDRHQLTALHKPGGKDPAILDRVLAFWSPDGTRVFLQVEVDTEPKSERTHRRWALRAAGPQIRVVEAGAGEPRARAVAAELAAAGLPVAVLQLRAQPVAQSSIVAVRRRKNAEALAKTVRTAMPKLPEPSSERRSREFASVVVLLGHDQHE